jgi:hypothetical protein
VTAYRYPDDGDELERVRREVARLRVEWLNARTDRDLALHRLFACIRAELEAETAFRAIATDHPEVDA